jgi:YidC/Oxa1 family membrane protein insertase
MNSEKRLIIAVALSVLIIIGYQTYMKQFYSPKSAGRLTADSGRLNKLQEQTTVTGGTGQAGLPQAEQVPANTIGSYSKQKFASPENIEVIKNEFYRAVFTTHGAAIKSLQLIQYRDKGGQPTDIALTEEGFPLILSTKDTTFSLPYDWEIAHQTPNSITFKAKREGLELEKKFILHNSNHIIELELAIKNTTPSVLPVRYKIITGPALVSDNYIEKRYAGADLQIGETVHRKRPNSKDIQGGKLFNGDAKWASVHSRYFSIIIKPEQQEQAGFIESPDKKNIWSGIVLGPEQIAPGATISRRYLVYAGPNDTQAIAALGPDSKNIISYGIFTGIARIIFKGLKFFYSLAGNYGFAVIMLAFVISGIMFPLTRKSLASMKEMQRIQPEVERIRKDYSDNPQKMNKEIMELYKEHKVNPIGGCLPMLLQLPIFISLYQVLIRSVELKGASFLWIKDLSEPDAAFMLPFTIPILGKYLNILPILMAVAMAIQQKVSQGGNKQATDQQRMMSTIMPVFLGVIFYNLPSGLVLYWLTNTVLMLVLQEVVLKSRQPAQA